MNRTAPVTSARVAEAIDALAVAVKNRWQTEAALRSRHGAPMPIHWRVTTHEGVQDRLAGKYSTQPVDSLNQQVQAA
jgi:hypothetical protein